MIARVKGPLERAHEASSLEEKLTLLLEAWTQRPLARTADLIGIVAERLPSRAPPKARTLAEAHAQWMRVVAEHDARDLDWLCKSVVTARLELSLARVRALERWPSDPRVARGLLAVIVDRPFTSEPKRPFWTAVFRLVSRIADVTSITTIDGLLGAAGVASFDAYVHDKLRTLKRKIEGKRPLETPSSSEAEQLDAIAAALVVPGEAAALKTEAEFLAEIFANPLEDGTREVFADWLLERGSPRGQFIALQMMRAHGRGTPEGLRRERALLAEHARAWMGPLEPAVHGQAFRFERGFLFFCKIDWRALLATPGLLKHPAWATVREYELAPAGERECDAWLDHMIALGAKRR